ncbi:MAG: HDOD domain-containing protein [Candidatus Marinarcus sp.]|uniref:HDOD domain-containing protein n=1 Tax=Candidatus Marinarcus sp. TaxID=3100987 RepID=UPI003B00FA51
MTYIELLKRVDTLAPLPKTLLQIEEFKKTDNFESTDLSKIIEQDPLMVSTILKTANSAMFGFVSKVDTLSRAISLLGVNFTISIALGSGIKQALESDLNAYGTTSDAFLRIANMQSNLISLWIGKIDVNLKNDLILPAFLQESGKFLINNAIVDENKTEEFSQKISTHFNGISNIEKEYVGMTTAEVTSAIFKHWNLTQTIIHSIKFSDEPAKALPQIQKHAQILYISKLVCNIVKPFDESSITFAKQKVVEYGFDLKPFEAAINKMQERLLDE